MVYPYFLKSLLYLYTFVSISLWLFSLTVWDELFLSPWMFVYLFLWPLRFVWLLVVCFYKEVYLQFLIMYMYIFSTEMTVAGSGTVRSVNPLSTPLDNCSYSKWLSNVGPQSLVIEHFLLLFCFSNFPLVKGNSKWDWYESLPFSLSIISSIKINKISMWPTLANGNVFSHLNPRGLKS